MALTCQAKTELAGRRVKFASAVRVKPIRPATDMSREETEAVWFTDDECEAMERELRDVVLSLRDSSTEKNEDSSHLMGLENLYSDDAYETHAARVQAGIDSVLLEQGRQRSLELIDVEMIARVYSKVTATAREEARTRGVQYVVNTHNEKEQISSKMAAAASTSTSFKKAERQGLTRASGQRQLKISRESSMVHDSSPPERNIKRGRRERSHSQSQEPASLRSSFEMPLKVNSSTTSRQYQSNRNAGSVKKVDVAVKNLRFISARIALSGRCAMPSRPKSYVALGA